MEIEGHTCVLAWTDRRDGNYFDVERDWAAAREKFDYLRSKCRWPKRELDTGIYLRDVSKYKKIAPPKGADVALFFVPVSEWQAGHLRFAWFEAPGGKAVTLLGSAEEVADWVHRLGHLRSNAYGLADEKAREVLNAPPRFSDVADRARSRAKEAFSMQSDVADLSGLEPQEMAGVIVELLGLANRLDEKEFVSKAIRARQIGFATAQIGFLRTGHFEFKNAEGSIHRRNGAWASSESAFRESIDLCSDAVANPHAYIGLAATLRRLAGGRTGAWDEAYDLLKEVGRKYPNYELYVRTHAALMNDRRVNYKFTGEISVGGFASRAAG